jgi:hypothetical protein
MQGELGLFRVSDEGDDVIDVMARESCKIVPFAKCDDVLKSGAAL